MYWGTARAYHFPNSRRYWRCTSKRSQKVIASFLFGKVFLVTSEIYKLVNNTFAYSFAGKTPQDSFCTNFITVFSGKVPETTFTYNLTIQYLIELFQ